MEHPLLQIQVVVIEKKKKNFNPLFDVTAKIKTTEHFMYKGQLNVVEGLFKIDLEKKAWN